MQCENDKWATLWNSQELKITFLLEPIFDYDEKSTPLARQKI